MYPIQDIILSAMGFVGDIMKYFIIFLTGGTAYNIAEYLWCGYSHWTMAIDGGICLLGIYFIATGTDLNFIYKVICSAGLITSVELISGIIINKILHWGVWDYSGLPMNFLGQICLRYTLLWAALCIPLVALIVLISEIV